MCHLEFPLSLPFLPVTPFFPFFPFPLPLFPVPFTPFPLYLLNFPLPASAPSNFHFSLSFPLSHNLSPCSHNHTFYYFPFPNSLPSITTLPFQFFLLSPISFLYSAFTFLWPVSLSLYCLPFPKPICPFSILFLLPYFLSPPPLSFRFLFISFVLILTSLPSTPSTQISCIFLHFRISLWCYSQAFCCMTKDPLKICLILL